MFGGPMGKPEKHINDNVPFQPETLPTPEGPALPSAVIQFLKDADFRTKRPPVSFV